ncbi:N-acetyltransferase [Sediminihabitans luteus]|uniref:GNAT family N-acetyltransferase n=1 Tax=Sediminihabitans luteus TaxID=1138585 RepID=UPI000C249FD9|nr:GNAT family N-acetyltransferase [Sediminihabitans luteus]GII99098.1 N-acetyltransferase [Sediminihabitans luteus]
MRVAQAADADAIARVHHACWVETYTGLVPEEFWQRGTLESRQRMWTAILGTPAAPRDPQDERAIVAEVVPASGVADIVGFALAGPARPDDMTRTTVAERQLSALYLLKTHHGTGIGQALLDAALPDTASIQLGVVEDNPRAVAFYTRNGFVPDGARGRLDWFGGLTEIRMVRAAR